MVKNNEYKHMNRIRIDWNLVDFIVEKANVQEMLFQYEDFKFTTSEQYANQYFYDVWSENTHFLDIIYGITYEVREEYEDIIVQLVAEKIDTYLKENGKEMH